MMTLTTVLHEKLAEANIAPERFRELLTRLLSYGVLVRDEDRTEQLLYDDARRIEGLLSEYLTIAGMNLHHDLNSQFFRLYPPGAMVDGMPDDDLAPAPSLKARLSKDFVAAAIALRFLYQEKLSQGNVDGGEALISLEDLAVTLQTQLKRPLTENATARESIFAELRRHRLVRYSATFMSDPDAYMAVRSTILSVVSNESLQVALDQNGTDSSARLQEEKILDESAQ